MTSLAAAPTIIIVDKEAGENTGTTNIEYSKERGDDLWERMPGSPWTPINVFVRTGTGDKAEMRGTYQISLKPGYFYEVGVFEHSHGPLSTDPISIATLTVFCLWKKPEQRRLVTDQNAGSGGTWHFHQIATSVTTRVVVVAVSPDRPALDSNGMPVFKTTEGAPVSPLLATNNHRIEIKPLRPGNRYFFLALVCDKFGNWEIIETELQTFRRKVTVEFATLHVFNDGDPSGHGEGEFLFRVSEGKDVLREFNRPTADIDDWNETDRPYSLGFAYLGVPKTVERGQESVFVFSRGIEDDGWDNDEVAMSHFGVALPLPAGRFVETVNSSLLKMDCPSATVGDDFHYGVDVLWSVDYVP